MRVADPPPALPAESIWPRNALEHLGHCPVCGKTDRQLVHPNVRDRIYFCAPGEWNVFRCSSCGAGYLDPRPNRETIADAYSTYYTHGDATKVEDPPRSGWRQFRVAQRNAYLNQCYGYQLKPATRSAPLGLSANRRLRFDRYVCFLPYPGPGARLLDVGCGNGRLMMQLRSVGWTVSGVEPDPKSAEQARGAGLDVQSTLNRESLPQAHFDAITMNHVIEHLHEPVDTLRLCAQAAKPGGMICIITPNFAAWGHQKFGRDWFALDPPRHLALFTPKALEDTLEQAGFARASMKLIPAPVAIHKNTNWIWRSMQIRLGYDPARNEPRLSLRHKIAAMWLAAKANRHARKFPDEAEELVLVARRKN
jgi:2-polyprenyl-3-methyl-5-hydroxy-6-metoxy-1,4-benzoquinol methylase